MILSPLDALKTTMQTEGDRALPLLRARIRNHGIGTLVSFSSQFSGLYSSLVSNSGLVRLRQQLPTSLGRIPGSRCTTISRNRFLLPTTFSNNFFAKPSCQSSSSCTVEHKLMTRRSGFVASVVSDTVSNSLRVLKTYRQVNARNVSYRTAVREVIKESGIVGLFGRGLGTRILANGLQGLMFSVLWKLFQELLA